MASEPQTYVVLLRGINVGGKNRVEMTKLKSVLEELGLLEVKTYINSGNAIFRSEPRASVELAAMIEKAIQKYFGFHVKALVRDFQNIASIVSALPASWKNDQAMKCDVLFLWEDIDSPKIVDQLTIKPEIDNLQYIKGALLWRVDRENINKSGMMKIVGTDLYKKMTIRNCNTTRKIYELMRSL